jgi:hypothetical protein
VGVIESSLAGFKVDGQIMSKLLVSRVRPVCVASHDVEPRTDPVKLPDLTPWIEALKAAYPEGPPNHTSEDEIEPPRWRLIKRGASRRMT